MSIVYYFLKIQPSVLADLLDNINELENTIYSYAITGDFDIVTKMEIDTAHEIGQMTSALQEMTGVRSLAVHMALD